MIRVAVIDGHPAMRAGIEALLSPARDIQVVAGASGDLNEVAHMLYSTTPDVVIVEDAPGRADGIELTRRIKGHVPAPQVVLYTDGVDPGSVASAMLAGADALVDSRGDERNLGAAVRSAARGAPVFPELDPQATAALEQRLPTEDQDILRMRLATLSLREIAGLLRIDAGTLRERLRTMIAALRVPAPGVS
jgi:DNA-binding NarL/FixJ family response regulator